MSCSNELPKTRKRKKEKGKRRKKAPLSHVQQQICNLICHLYQTASPFPPMLEEHFHQLPKEHQGKRSSFDIWQRERDITLQEIFFNINKKSYKISFKKDNYHHFTSTRIYQIGRKTLWTRRIVGQHPTALQFTFISLLFLFSPLSPSGWVGKEGRMFRVFKRSPVQR